MYYGRLLSNYYFPPPHSRPPRRHPAKPSPPRVPERARPAEPWPPPEPREQAKGHAWQPAFCPNLTGPAYAVRYGSLLQGKGGRLGCGSVGKAGRFRNYYICRRHARIDDSLEPMQMRVLSLHQQQLGMGWGLPRGVGRHGFLHDSADAKLVVLLR